MNLYDKPGSYVADNPKSKKQIAKKVSMLIAASSIFAFVLALAPCPGAIQ